MLMCFASGGIYAEKGISAILTIYGLVGDVKEIREEVEREKSQQSVTRIMPEN